MTAYGGAEARRLSESDARTAHWKRWGPYLAERQWGTVREDYSPQGHAWEYFPHDHARSRAYRWGEDGILGISDNHERLCFALALWNGRDPILKERLFGLAGPEGNHGEDVKEYYFYLDSTPTHSYMKGLYKYPQAAFPYAALVEENRRRGRDVPEFELIDTGVFEGGRYWDVTIEYAKAAVERGERVAFFVFDEVPNTLVIRGEGMGMNIKQHIDQGKILVRQVDPAELSPGQFVQAEVVGNRAYDLVVRPLSEVRSA